MSTMQDHIDFGEVEKLICESKIGAPSDTIRGKKVIIIMGPTGAGKTTFVHRLAGNKLVKEGERFDLAKPEEGFKIGHHKKSETRFTALKTIQKKKSTHYIIDSPGFFDTEGDSIDIANMVSISDVFKAAKKVVLVFLIPWNNLTQNRGGALRDLCDLMALLMVDVNSFTKNFMVYFSHVPSEKSVGDIRKEIEEILDASTEQNTSEDAKKILKYMLRKKPRKPIAIFHPIDEKEEEDLLEDIDDLKGMPGDNFKINLPPKTRNVLNNNLNFIENNLIEWLETGQTKRIADIFQVLDIIGEEMNDIKQFLQRICKAVENFVSTQQHAVLKRFSEMLQSRHIFSDGLDRLRTFIELIPTLGPILPFFKQKPVTLIELADKVTAQLSKLITELELSTTQFTTMNQILSILMEMSEFFSIDPHFLKAKGFAVIARETVKKKVEELQSEFATAPITEDSAPRIGELLDGLKNAATEVASLIEMNVEEEVKRCESTLCNRLDNIEEKSYIAIEEILESTTKSAAEFKESWEEITKKMATLLTNYAMLRNFENNSTLESIIRSEPPRNVRMLQKMTQKLVDFIAAKEEKLKVLGDSSSSEDLLYGTLKVIQEFRDLFPSVKQPTGDSYRSLSTYVRGKLHNAKERVLSELQNKSDVQYGVLIKDLQILKNSGWMAPYIPEITGIYEQAIQYMKCSIRNLGKKIRRAWNSHNYSEVENLYDKLAEMDDLSVMEDAELDPKSDIEFLTQKKAEFFADLQTRLKADDNEEIKVNLVDRDYKRIGETSSLFAKLEGCKEQEIVADLEDYLGNYLNHRIKAIRTHTKDFAFQSSVLDLLTTVESLKFLPERFRQKRDQALKEVRSAVGKNVIHPLEAALDNSQYAEAQTFLALLEDAENNLCNYLPSISQDLARLRERHRDGVKESTSNIAAILDSDDYNQVNNVLEVLPTGQLRSVKTIIYGHLQKKKRGLLARIRRISLKNTDDEHAALLDDIRNLYEANIMKGFVDEDFTPSMIAIEITKALDSKCKQELRSGWAQFQLNSLVDWELALAFWKTVQDELPSSLREYLTESQKYLEEIEWKANSSTTGEMKKKIQECIEKDDLATLAAIYEETSQTLNTSNEFRSVQLEINASMKTYFDKQLKEIEILPGLDKADRLNNFTSQFTQLPQIFTRSFHIQLQQCEKIMQQANEQTKSVINNFAQHLADKEWDQAADLYKRHKGDHTFKSTFDERLETEMKTFNSNIKKALDQPSAEYWVSALQQIENFLRVFFPNQPSPFVPDKNVLQSLQNHLSDHASKITTGCQWTDVITYSRLPMAIYQFSWARRAEDEDQISKVFNEIITKRLSEVATSFKQGRVQLDIPKIVNYLQVTKFIDSFVTTLISFAKADTLSKMQDLEKELSEFIRHQEAVEITLKDIDLLPEKVKEHWNTKNTLAMQQCLTACDNVGSLFKYIDKIKATIAFDAVKAFFESKLNDTFKEAETCLANSEWDKFNKAYHDLGELKPIASLLRKDFTEGISKQIEKSIQRIEEHGRNSSSPEEVAKDLCYLYEEQERFPFAKDLIKRAESNILHRPSQPEFVKGVGKQLVMLGDRVANQVIAGNNQHFGKIYQEMWVGKTKGQGIDYALQHFKLQDDAQNLWEKLKGVVFGGTFKDYYVKFDKIFMGSVNDKISRGSQGIVEIVNEVLEDIKYPNIVTILAQVFAVWTLNKSLGSGAISDAESFTLFKPHPVQVLSLFRLLIGSTTSKLNIEKQLIEVLTGEGKSIILGACATVYALLGYTVTCTSYSGYLSERDYNDFKDIFDYFKITSRVRYCPVDGLCESMMNQHGNIRDLTTSVLEGKALAHGSISANKEKTVLLIDEVDVLFSPAFYGETYNPATVYGDDTTYDLLQYIWSKKNSLTLDNIYVSVPFKNLLAKFPTWETLLKSSVNNMLADSKSDLEERTYNVLNDTIGYLMNDEYSYSTIFRYQTAFLYFLLHDRGVIKDEQTVRDQVGLIIACGNFSYAEIPKYFDVIIGVTGTLGDLSTVERKIVEDQFGIRKLAFAPTMYGAPKRKFDEKDDVVVIADMDQWYLRILQQTQSKIRGKRAVIVFFETVKTLEAFERRYKTELDTMKYRILDEKSLHKDNLVRQATASGTITLSTASFTRGTDFVCRDPSTESNGGVHVIVTYPTDTAADEIQARGRTGRQGDSGSYELVLYEKDLEKFEIKPADVTAHSASGIYSFIKQKRDEQHAKRVKDLIEKAQKMLMNHNLSNEFRDALVKGNNKNAVINYLLRINQAISQKTVSIPYHIVFALDESYSMKGQPWADLKQAVNQFINKRLEYYASAGVQCADVVTVVCYDNNARITVPTIGLTNQIANRIPAIRGGGTDFSVGLRKAHEVITQIDPTRYTPALLFMSDGEGSGGEIEIQMIRRDSQACQIFTIGFGSGCDSRKLQLMATISGGKYMYGANGLQLMTKFEEICTELSSPTLSL